MTLALASCMRNEGVFLMEWVAHHSGLGFDTIFVVTNNITDDSDVLLDALAAKGRVVHLPQVVAEGTSPQDTGMDLVLAEARARGITHLLHIDSDEFLVLHEGGLSDLLARTKSADVVPLPWRMFGDGGVTEWIPGDLVTECNTRAEPVPMPGETKFKCLFRVASFARATDHNPLEPLVENPVVMTPDGAELHNASLYQRKSARFRPHELAAAARSAQLYHYAVRSEDCFLMKNDRGDGQGKLETAKYHLNSQWYQKANRNDVTEDKLAAQAPGLRRTIAAWRTDPAVAEAEDRCKSWFVETRARLLTAERRNAWTRRKASA